MPTHACARALVVAAIISGALTAPASAQPRRVFFGNLHSHTSYSDGSGTPEQAFLHARDIAHLDFLAITEHNHKSAESGAGERRDGLLIATAPALYIGPQADGLIPAAGRFTEDGRFVALFGQEFNAISKGNHVNIFDIDQVIPVPNDRFDQLVTWLNAHPDRGGNPAVMQFNHPSLNSTNKEYGADDFDSAAEWVAAIGRFASLIEVLNGPAMTKVAGHRAAETMERDYLDYLNRGFHLAPTADQDNHYFTWGSATDARTAVIAPALTKRDVIDALRARHVYATEDPNLSLILEINGHLQGDVVTTLPAVGSTLDIRLSVQDQDEPNGSYEVEVFSDDGPGGNRAASIATFALDGNTAPGQPLQVSDVSFRGAGQYVFLKIHQVNEDGEGDLAWTAPVWFEVGTGLPAVPMIRIASLLPNPLGDESQDEEVTLRNRGTASVNLATWVLRDAQGRTWSLASLGSIPAGGVKTIRRGGQPMSLNNGGDTVSLVTPDGVVAHQVTYPAIAEGQRHQVPEP